MRSNQISSFMKNFNNKLATTPLLDNNRLFLNNTGKQTNSQILNYWHMHNKQWNFIAVVMAFLVRTLPHELDRDYDIITLNSLSPSYINIILTTKN